MKIVASTRLNKANAAMDTSRTYGKTSNAVFENAETKPLDGKKTLYVVASSDKGLCGGIHSGLSKATRNLLAENHPERDADLVILGEKAKAQLSRTADDLIRLSFANVGKDIPTFTEAQAIADQIAQLPEEYGSIKIVYNRFVNATSFEPTVVEAFSEEAITQSRMLRFPILFNSFQLHKTIFFFFLLLIFSSFPLSTANISAFEIDDEALANLRSYALANNLFWALAEGHACEISVRPKNSPFSTMSCTTANFSFSTGPPQRYG